VVVGWSEDAFEFVRTVSHHDVVHVVAPRRGVRDGELGLGGECAWDAVAEQAQDEECGANGAAVIVGGWREEQVGNGCCLLLGGVRFWGDEYRRSLPLAVSGDDGGEGVARFADLRLVVVVVDDEAGGARRGGMEKWFFSPCQG
jgi:hypothetical protein